MASSSGNSASKADGGVSLAGVVARYGLPALFLGAGVEGETVVVIGGILAHKGLVSLPGAMAATAAGSFTADQLFFLIGRRASGWKLVERLRGNPLYGRALGWLERYPIGFIFAFRFIYGFRTISPFAIGTSRVPERLFLLVNAVAAIVWGCLFTGLGYVFGRTAEKVLGRYMPGPRGIAVAVGVVIVGLFVWHLGRRWRQRGR
jgi:membrane protein DedA with SNARE-associated domain